MRIVSLFLQCSGVILAGVAIWMYLAADALDETGSFRQILTAAGIMIVGVVLTLVGKQLKNRNRDQSAIETAKSDDRAPRDIEITAPRLQRNAPSPPPVSKADASARFRPVLSRGDHQSWIGGEPEMDDGLEWPSSGETPMSFIAQVHCPDIPAEACRGFLPKEGWLVFFYAGGYEPNSAVIHTRSRKLRYSTPDIQPEGHLFLAPHRFIDPPKTAPRVPIEPVEGHVSAEALFDEERRSAEDEGIGASMNTWREGFDLKNPAFQPFDAASAKALVAVIHEVLQKSADIDPKRFWEDKRKMIETRAAGMSAFETAFRRELSGNAMVGLDPESRADLISRLEDFEISENENALDLANRMRGNYLETFGWITRVKWFNNRDDVPPEVYDAVSPCWQQKFDGMPLVVGARGTKRTRSSLRDYLNGVPAEESICLLMLTTNSFMGWNFGDASDLAFYMAPDALSDLAWDEVVAVDTHGH